MDIEAALKAELASYDHTEWSGEIGGQPITLCAKPLSSADITAVRRKHPDFTTQPTPSGMIMLIMRKSVDGDGNRVFTPKHGPLFERLKTTVVTDIFNDLFGSQFEDDDDETSEERVKK